jgi:DNA-binding NarL/FixJ family response regulator
MPPTTAILYVYFMTDSADPPITILTADDHPLIRDGLAGVLLAEDGMRVVAEASNGEEAIEAYAKVHPDIVLMDLRMPVMDGLTATRAILADDPNARIIVLTTYNGDEDIHRALAAGARGYLLKDMMRTDLISVIRAVHRGQRGIPATVASRLAEHTPRIGLTPRELEVLRFVAEGLSNAQVADRIGRTEGTVKVHLKNILQKLDVHDRTEAVTTALRRGFIRLD